jgi:hypothetical protein
MAFLLSSSPEKAKPANPYDFDLASDDEDAKGIIFFPGKSSKTATVAAARLPPPTAAAYVKKRPGSASIASSSSSGSSGSSTSSSFAEVLAEEDNEGEEEEKGEDDDASTRRESPRSHGSLIPGDGKEQLQPNPNEISPRFLTIDDLDAVLVAEEEHLQEEGKKADAEEAEAGAITHALDVSASTPSLLSTALHSSLVSPLTSRIIKRRDQGTQCTGNDTAVQTELGELNAPILAHPALLNSPIPTSTFKQASRREIWLAYLALLEEQQAQFVRTRKEMMALLQQARRTKEKWSTGQNEEDAVVAAMKRQIAQF